MQSISQAEFSTATFLSERKRGDEGRLLPSVRLYDALPAKRAGPGNLLKPALNIHLQHICRYITDQSACLHIRLIQQLQLLRQQRLPLHRLQQCLRT